MSLQLTNYKFFITDNTTAFWVNVPQASQAFSLKITSVNHAVISSGGAMFLGKAGPVCIYAMFMQGGTATTSVVRFRMDGVNGSVQSDQTLTHGSVYKIAVTWDGVANAQYLWLNGTPTKIGSIAGNLYNSNNVLFYGTDQTNCQWVLELDDHNMWNNYVLTASDVQLLLKNGDPTTIGASATRRCRWTLAGTIGGAAAVGDAGLKNAYGGGAVQPTGDGSDVKQTAGTGTAIYTAVLVWSPSVSATPYIATSGKIVVFYPFSPDVGGTTTPTQIITVPTISVNGTSLGVLQKSWFSGYHPFLFFSTPGSYQIQPGDVVTVSAPDAWASTSAGSVRGFNNASVDNRSGRSSFGGDTARKTMSVATNLNQRPMLWDLCLYQPLLNWNFLICWPPGNRGKVTQQANGLPLQQTNGNNLIDHTTYPGQPGLWLVRWSVHNPAAPTSVSLGSSGTGFTTVNVRGNLRQRPANGIGYMDVFDVENIAGNTAGTNGSYVAATGVAVTISDPSGNPSTNYYDLWVCAPGDWDIVNGVPVLDISDRFALSRRFLDRMPPNVSLIRWLAAGPVDGNPTSLPYPEYLQNLTDENFGYLNSSIFNIGVSSFNPVDTIATPYVYSPFLGRAGVRGQTFTATLAANITTTPAVGTLETWVFTDGATAPLMTGLEIQIDSEICRIVRPGSDANHWVMYRGSNLTTPATHTAGPVTVFGRIAITAVINADGTLSNNLVLGTTTNTPHLITTGNGFGSSVVGFPIVTFTTGEVWNQFLSVANFVTGPKTLFSIYHSTSPSGGKPNQVYNTTPANTYAQYQWPASASIPHEAQALLTSRFSNANYWCNLWYDASDDLVYQIANRVLANLATGRKVYVEVANEPWNSAFSSYFYGAQMGGLILPDHQTLYYAHTAFRHFDIFRSVFGNAGRGSDVVGVLNCQLGGADASAYLTWAQARGEQVDAVAVAPYIDTESTSLNGSYINTIDDEQLVDMWLHDLWYNPRTYTSYVQTVKNAISAYNQATGHNCFLTAYECGVEYPVPYNGSSQYPYERTHDFVTNPNFYLGELDFYLWMQTQGFTSPMLSSFSEGWGANSGGWQTYHAPFQDHGRGDGSDGKLNNLLCRARPTAPNYKGSNVNQEANTVSVRGQAWLDWMASLAASGTIATAYTLTAPVPASGQVGHISGNFTITPNGVYTGHIMITPSGGGLSTPIVLTFTNSNSPQTFTITPTSFGTVVLTATNDGGLTNPSTVNYSVPNPTTYYTLVGPISGNVGVISGNFTVTPNAAYTGHITITPSGGGLSTPIVLTFTNSSSPQTFTITPTASGTVRLVATNDSGLTNPSDLNYNVMGSAISYTFTGPTSGQVGLPSGTFVVTPNAFFLGHITITLSGGGFSTPIVLTFTNSSSPQAFTIVSTYAGTVTLTPMNDQGLIDPPSLSYSAIGSMSSRYYAMTAIKKALATQETQRTNLAVLWYRKEYEVSDFVTK
jgi:hypothetical protein